MLYGKKWNNVIIHPYTGPKCLIYNGICGYNFSSCKYICDVELLKTHKYSYNELLDISNCLGLSIRKNISRYELQDLIYSNM